MENDKRINSSELTKESVVKKLENLVDRLANKHSNFIGVVFYGSRTHDRHKNDSDIDLIPIYFSDKRLTSDTAREVNSTLCGTFDLAKIDDHPIYLELLQQGFLDDLERLYWAGIDQVYLDRESIIITKPKHLAKALRQFYLLKDKDWSRLGTRPLRDELQEMADAAEGD